MPYLYTPAQFAQARQRLVQLGVAASRPRSDFAMLMYQFIYVGATDSEARSVLAERLQQTYQQPFEHLVSRYCTAGTPQTCRNSLQAYIDAGAREFILTPPVRSPQEFRQQLDIYATDIIPGLVG